MPKGPLVKYTVEEVLDYHRNNPPGHGKIEVLNKTPVGSVRDLTLAYTPGVAEISKLIGENPEEAYNLTSKSNLVAVVSDGTAVLGLGNVGPDAALPVMEGKCALFKGLAGVDAFPICLRTQDPDEIIETVKNLSTSFGGINLEDIAAPACFKIERTLKKELEIPVFHDDQHGTAIVTLAGLINALKIVNKKPEEIKVVFSGAGAAGIACSLFYQSAGVKDIILCDSRGAIYEGREKMNAYKEEIAKTTNRDQYEGDLAGAMNGADVFVGLSAPNIVNESMVRSMATDAVVFACANPVPEIMPEKAHAAGAKIVATGRSDYPNQINNVLGFPGIFRGALDTRAKDINEEMKLAAANAIANLITGDELSEDYIITTPVDPRVMSEEAAAVAEAAIKSGVARIKTSPDEVREKTKSLVEDNRKRCQRDTS